MASLEPEQRFWKNVDTSGRCWLWTASVSSEGYGKFSLPGKRWVNAHRWLYQQLHGDLPAEVHVHHVCEVRACVNPAHLTAMPMSEHVRLRHRRCKKGHLLEGDNVAERIASDRSTGRKRFCRECAAKQPRELARARAREERGYAGRWPAALAATGEGEGEGDGT